MLLSWRRASWHKSLSDLWVLQACSSPLVLSRPPRFLLHVYLRD
jgi:hypothetical protein